MRVDVQSLETVNQLAHEGAQAATGSLTQLTGIDATVDVTTVTFTDRADVGQRLAGQEVVGVQFAFEGAFEGETVLAFEADSVGRLTEALVGDAGAAMRQSSVEEVGNIMMSGFIDGWADYLGATIDHSPPEYVEGSGAGVVPAGGAADRSHVFVFTSTIEWVGEPVDFYIYMVPEYEALADLLEAAGDGQDAIPLDKLEVFNEMSAEGAATAADNLEMMTGLPTTAEVTRTSFAPIEDVPSHVGTDPYVGTVVEFTGRPSGYLAVLFEEPAAVEVAEALMPTAPDGDGFTAAHEGAIQELGNVLTSGFVDGWANVLQTSIEHTPPRLVQDMGRAIVDPLAAQVGQTQEHAFVIDSTMETESLAFAADIYALPDEAELRAALSDLDVERADQTEADVEEIFE